MTSGEFRQALIELGYPSFRADQINDWIFKKQVFDTERMTNLPQEIKALIGSRISFSLPEIVRHQQSKRDQTEKFLLGLEDAQTIESVLLHHKDRITACISSQVGCPLKCDFCATGQSGFQRNLRCEEITGQVLVMEKHRNSTKGTPGRSIGNVVFMGMGEPLLNYESVKQAVGIFTDPKQFGISKRRISISTAGIVPAIDRLGKEIASGSSGLSGITLSVSLHAPNNAIRDKLMPINRKYPVEELVFTIRKYIEMTGDRVTIEYILIEHVNDSDEAAEELCQLLKGLKVNINLIPFNPVQDSYRRPGEETIQRFLGILERNGIESVLRIEKGTDIEGACGQLRNKGDRS
jgi:23S rRNA (adenine2503-C2)-methyltransferase